MQDPSSVDFPGIRPPAPFPEQELLKCPRCDSANTKFCYYNNYNLSQPRYFCKDCRRYWTKGGALRNIPVGGGTRKSSSAGKRSSNPKRANPDPTPDSPRVTRRVSEAPPSPPPSSSTPAAVADTFSASTQQYRLPTTESEPGQNPTRVYGLEADQERKFAGVGVGGGSFSSLLTPNSQFGGIFDGLSTSGSDLKSGQVGGLFGEDLSSGLSMGSGREMGLDVELQERGGGAGGGSGGGDDGGGGGYLQGGEWGNSNNGWPDLAIYTPGSNFH
ncbi:unnamed protein product [Linum tenue]|uniref:Dof zinc finger protein n=1 Tax=Linum tenue TaxID=586396 RepID=A0AAV0I3B5_9ROSI|nr:unnamed protein product [Linum tenue]